MPSRKLTPRTAEELDRLADELAATARRLRKIAKRLGPFGFKVAPLHEAGIFGEWRGKLAAFVQDAERKTDKTGV